MRNVVVGLTFAATCAFAANAGAQTGTLACARGDYVRTVSVVSAPSADRACEVHYEKTSEGGQSEVLWFAESDPAFCDSQAEKLTTRLIAAGWTCTPRGASADQAAAMTETFAAEPLSVALAPGGEGVTGSIRRGAVPADAPRRGPIDPNDPALKASGAPDLPPPSLRPALR